MANISKTQIINQTAVIAIYDGYEKQRFNSNIELWVRGANTILTKNGSPSSFDVYNGEYHTNDNWLMPVARKLLREMEDMRNSSVSDNTLPVLISSLVSAFTKSTAELCNRVYHVIVGLNQIKE